MPRTAKTKKKPSEKEVGGDGFKAILLVVSMKELLVVTWERRVKGQQQ
jgi:hypothetical protein